MADDLNDYIGRPAYRAWAESVAARGGVATRVPAKIDATHGGQIAARFPKEGNLPASSYRYELAPLKVRALDSIRAIGDEGTIIAGKVAEGAEKLARGTLWLIAEAVVIAVIVTIVASMISRAFRSSARDAE